MRAVTGSVAAAAAAWLFRVWAEPSLGPGLLARIALLGGILVAGGIPYVLIAGSPFARWRRRSDTGRRR